MKSVKVILSPEAREVFEYLNREALISKTESQFLKQFIKK